MGSVYEKIAMDPQVRRYGIPVLGAFAGFQILWYLNSWLSQKALNRFVSNSHWDWSKEVVVVTGGSGGIGSRIVEILANRGVKVISLDMIPAKFSMPPGVCEYRVDLSDREAIASTWAQIRSEHGDPTVLINNAAIAPDQLIVEASLDKVQKTFAVNNVAHWQLVQEFLPYMIKQNHGHVVTVASMASFVARAANVDYAASKSAALAFHDGLSQELAVYYDAPRVRTTSVHPAWVRTPMLQRFIDTGKFKETTIEPEVVAQAIVKQLYSGGSGQIYTPSWLGTSDWGERMAPLVDGVFKGTLREEDERLYV